jgi:hypothetical protein
MASGKSNYLSQKLLDHEFGISAFTFPTTAHLALFTTSPGPGNTGVEVSGASYARVAVALSSGQWSRAGNTVTNVNLQVFPIFSASVATVVAVGVYDAASAGNLLWFADLGAPYQKSFSANDQAVYPASSISVTES